MSDMQESSLEDMMTIFFKDPPDHYDALSEMVTRFDYEILPDITEAQSLIPTGQIPNNDVHVCYTDFENAPYLITTRALANIIQGEDQQKVAITTRRIALLEVEEETLFEWLCDFAGADPVKKDEGGGNHSWYWTKLAGSNIVQDGFRLYVSPEQGMFLVDRIVTARV